MEENQYELKEGTDKVTLRAACSTEQFKCDSCDRF